MAAAQTGVVALNFANVTTGGNLIVLAGSQALNALDLGAFARLFSGTSAGSEAAAATPDDGLHIRIKDAMELSNAGSARASLGLLEKFQRDEWASASPRNRCRLLAATGFARFVLDDQDGAIRDFRVAYAENPDHAGARAVLALAQYLSGETEAAFTSAKQALLGDPDCEQAALVLPLVAPAALTFPEVQALIPVALQGKPDVLIGLVTAARDRGDGVAALCIAEDAYARAPNDWRACSTLAEELLAPIFEDKAIALTKTVPTRLAGSFRRGLDLLRQAWDGIKAGDHARRMGHIAANLAAALVIAGDDEGASRAITEGLQLRPTDPVLLHHRAVALAVQNDWSGAHAALSCIQHSELESNDSLFLGRAALACGNTDGARRAAAEALDRLPVGDRAREGAAALALEVELATGGSAAAIMAAWDAYPNSIVVRSAALEAAKVDEALRDRLLNDLIRIASSTTDLRDLALAADALGALGEYSQSADLFATLPAPLDRDTPVLRGRLRGLVMADRRLEARKLFESVAAPVRVLRPYFEFGISLYERNGMWHRALKLAEQHLGREPDDLRVRLAWLDLCERTGQMESARTWLAGVPVTIAGGAHELMMVAQLVDRQLADTKCLRIGYRALRQGYNDEKVHVGYTFGLFMFGRAAQGGRPIPDRVAPDTAVTLEKVGGGRVLVRILETEPEPRIERDEVPPSDGFASRLIGLSVGDEIDLPVLGAEPDRFRVKQIQDKFLHAHYRSLGEFHGLFPQSRAFSTFTVDVERGVEGIEPVLGVVRRHAEHAADLQGRYRNGGVPLALIAAMAGSSVFDVWDSFSANPDMPIFCSAGTQEEADRAFENLRVADLCVMDPLVPYSAVRLGTADLLRASFPRLAVTQTTLDMLRALVEQRREERRGYRGSLAWDGSHYIMHEMSEAMIEERIAVAEQALSFAEDCQVVPAEAANPVVPEAVRIYEAIPSAFLDAAISAQEPGRVLLCDDYALRAMAEVAAGVRGVWTQAVLQHGLLGGQIVLDDYADAVAKLAEAGYSFIRLGATEILHEFRRCGWHASTRSGEFLRRLALPSNDFASVAQVAQELLLRGWMEAGGDAGFDRLASALAEQFEQAQPGAAYTPLNAILKNVCRFLHAQAWTLNRRAWLHTTSLVPPWIAGRRVLAPANRIGRRIAAAMVSGLGAASSRGVLQSKTPPA